MSFRLLSRVLSLGVLSSLAACVAAGTDVPEEPTEAKNEALIFPPIDAGIFFPIHPEWLQRCGGDTGSFATRFFVRKDDCNSVSGNGGVWVGTQVFRAGSGFCSYSWRSTLGEGPDYWALDGAAKVFTLPHEPVEHGVISDCMPTRSTCIGNTGVPGDCAVEVGHAPVVLAKTVNPCGSCGVVSLPSYIEVVIPPDWVGFPITFMGYGSVSTVYNTHQQAFVVPIPSYPVVNGDPVTVIQAP